MWGVFGGGDEGVLEDGVVVGFGDVDEGIGVDVDVVERLRVVGEEVILDWCEVEVGVCEEKEGDFEFRVWGFGGKMWGGFGGGVVE